MKKKPVKLAVEPVKQDVYNNTTFTMDEIKKFQVLGTTASKWRQRDVTLLQHPTDANSVVSVGVAFDRTAVVIAVEPREDWKTALDYAARGKVYVSE